MTGTVEARALSPEGEWREVHCPACGKLLMRRRAGGEQETLCRCKRLVRVLASGRVVVVRDAAAG